MQKLDFGEALDLIYRTDSRYDRDTTASSTTLSISPSSCVKKRRKAPGTSMASKLIEGIRQ